MIDVAILTPDPAARAHDGLWRRVLGRLQHALAKERIRATPTPWTLHADDAGGLLGHAGVLPLLAWGYHHDHARWLRACATWQHAGVPMANPAGVLAWNSDKRYLAGLAACGVDMPATTWMRGLSPDTLERAFDETGVDTLVVKPAVSGGAWRTRRLHRDDAFDTAFSASVAGTDLLLQPYLPTIATAGETSLLFFGGALSHAVNKRPVPGEFRVQEEFGGHYTLLGAPPAAALALAERTLAAIDAPLLYARIDLVPDAEGRWLLMEAELIEPDFYLGVDPAQGTGFARALRGWLQQAR